MYSFVLYLRSHCITRSVSYIGIRFKISRVGAADTQSQSDTSSLHLNIVNQNKQGPGQSDFDPTDILHQKVYLCTCWSWDLVWAGMGWAESVCSVPTWCCNHIIGLLLMSYSIECENDDKLPHAVFIYSRKPARISTFRARLALILDIGSSRVHQ